MQITIYLSRYEYFFRFTFSRKLENFKCGRFSLYFALSYVVTSLYPKCQSNHLDIVPNNKCSLGLHIFDLSFWVSLENVFYISCRDLWRFQFRTTFIRKGILYCFSLSSLRIRFRDWIKSLAKFLQRWIWNALSNNKKKNTIINNTCQKIKYKNKNDWKNTRFSMCEY